jgi:chemotaxis protein MotB
MRERHAGSLGHEGSYLESLSDLFVGFLFIFIIFLMLFVLLLAEERKKTEAVRVQLTDAGALRSKMLEEIEDALKRRGILITIDTRNGIARLPESLLFDSGSWQIRSGGEPKLKIVAQELHAVLPCYAYGLPRTHACIAAAHPILDAMFIEGHTDNVPFQDGDNYELSARRSEKVFQMLKNDQPGLSSLTNGSGVSGKPLMGISAYGPDRPLNKNRTAEERSANRRIDLRFIVGTPKTTEIENVQTNGRLPL